MSEKPPKPREILDLRGRSEKTHRFFLYAIVVPGFVGLLLYPLLKAILAILNGRP